MMARYIDAELFKQDIKMRYCNNCSHPNEIKCRACHVDDMLGEIEDAPTADVVEVVRCKDCKFCKKIKYDSGKTTYHCKFCMSQSIPDDMVDDSLFDIGEFFCGLGKRSEEYDGKIY